MKKSMTFMVTLLALASFAMAGFSVGPRVGLNLANISNKDIESDSRIGFQGGVQAEFTLLNIIGVQSGLLYTTKGAQVEVSALGIKSTTTTKLNYLEVPVNGVFKLNLIVADVLVLTGPYFAYGLNGKVVSETGSVKTDIDLKFGDKVDQVKPFDFGWNFGIGGGLLGLQVTAQYGLGLTNTSNVDKVKTTNSVFSLAAAYLF